MQLKINDQSYEIPAEPDRPLLWVLRDELGLYGTRFGCGAGLCGACTVHVDGKATRSCITTLSRVAGSELRTIEGLAATADDGRGGVYHPVQRAFLNLQVPQCGWCMSGQIMTAAALIDGDPEITEPALLEGMNGNLCRCGTHVRIRAAVLAALREKRGEVGL
jgi:isoquinoline 1-oxidoreductase alpha subunit